MMNGVISAGTETAAAVTNSLNVARAVGRVVADLGVDMDGGHLRETDEQSRDHAGEIERADRHRSTPPQTIIRIDGGMITASTADTAVIAIENERS